MTRRPALVLSLLAAFLGGGAITPLDAEAASPPRATTLHVFAAASLADAFGDLARRLEQQRPGLAVRVDLGGSQALAMQIEQGASADVFASADDRWMDHVRDLGLLQGESAIFARNRLVVIVPRANPARIRRLQDLARAGVKLVLGADAVPVGRYARLALRNLARDPALGADFAEHALRNVVSEEENVKSVVGKVQLGEADAGIVYRSDVTPGVAPDLEVIDVPADADVVASYPIARLKAGREPGAARAFVDLVLSSEGQQVLARHGFLPAAETRR